MSLPDVEYRLIEGTVLPREAGPVIDGGGITMFWCPCMARRVVVWNQEHPETKGHKVSYADDGAMTIKGSIGYVASGDHDREDYRRQNWCHAHVTAGRFKLCPDAICPGASA